MKSIVGAPFYFLHESIEGVPIEWCIICLDSLQWLQFECFSQLITRTHQLITSHLHFINDLLIRDSSRICFSHRIAHISIIERMFHSMNSARIQRYKVATRFKRLYFKWIGSWTWLKFMILLFCSWFVTCVLAVGILFSHRPFAIFAPIFALLC